MIAPTTKEKFKLRVAEYNTYSYTKPTYDAMIISYLDALQDFGIIDINGMLQYSDKRYHMSDHT